MRIRNCTIRINPGFILTLSCTIFLVGFQNTILVLVAVLLHELGHIAAIYAFGGGITSITAGAAGLEIGYAGRFSYRADVIAALSGPAASLLAAVAFSYMGCFFKLEQLLLFSGINLIYCLFNLIPAGAADGGRAVFAVTAALFGPFTAEKTSYVLDVLCFFTVLATGIYVFAKSGGNLTLILCAILLAEVSCKRLKNSVKFLT